MQHNPSDYQKSFLVWQLASTVLPSTFLWYILPNHTEGHDEAFTRAQKTAVAKFNKIACTPDNMLYKALKEHYNTNKWLKMCITAGSIVLGITLASQFAFGKQDKVTKQVANG